MRRTAGIHGSWDERSVVVALISTEGRSDDVAVPVRRLRRSFLSLAGRVAVAVSPRRPDSANCQLIIHRLEMMASIGLPRS